MTEEEAAARQAEKHLAGAQAAAVNAPAEVRGVFVGDACVYNAGGGYYAGMVRKGDIKLGLKQVKQGEKGKYGEIAGRELTGDFEQSAAPLYLWLRRDGTLELISGRHRFAKMMEDGKVEAHMCYVFLEDEVHDERWATMLDYENNMRDDQADEKTAAVYIRTMPQEDSELYRKGLLRNATRSKRGIFIGRHARQNLFDLFMNDKVSAKDAEVICQLTQNLTDEARVEEIQSRAAGLLREGKSWEYIGGMTQLLANKERVTMRQGLLDFGADFKADLDKMARCIEANMQALKNAIKLLKMGKKLSKDNRAEAERLGVIASTGEDSEGKLRALTEELTRWEYVGSYPDLIAAVQMWDGETVPDPVGRVMEEYERQREGAQGGEDVRWTMDDGRWGNSAPAARGEVPEGQGALDFSASVRERGADAPELRVTNYELRVGNSAAVPLREVSGNGEQVESEFSAAMSGSPLAMSAQELRDEKPGADEDGELRIHGLTGLEGEAARARAMEQAVENVGALEGIVRAAARAAGGRVMMRPANNENGQATKAPSVAFAKAERDYGGDISRVVDLIGGTCVLPNDGSYATAVEGIRAALPEGCSVAKVKKLGFNQGVPCYQDVKVSVRFANGGVGEVIIVSELMNEAKFNRGGHAVYELSRQLEPYQFEHPLINECYKRLNDLSSMIYAGTADEAAFERAKALASSAVQHLPLESRNASLSSRVIMSVKSSVSLLNLARPLSVNSAAIPNSSEIANDISGKSVADGDGNVKKNLQGGGSFSVSEARERGLFKDGKLEAVNGVLVDGGADFSASVDFSHVSRALFRRPDREHVGTGEGAQAYGWGVIYGAEHPGVNREYHGDFTTEEEVFVQGHGENAKKIPQEELVAALKKRGVTNPRLASAWTSKEDLIEDRKTTKSVVQELEEMLEREEGKEKENTRRALEQEKQRLLAADYFIENDILATKGIEYPVNYRMRADVDDSNVLLWDESFDYFWANHEEVQDALKALLPADVFDSLWGGEDGYGIWQAITGGGFYEILTKQLGSPRAASEWLDEHGIRGVKYIDGVSRGRWERREEDEPYTYNYVIFNPDYIEVIAINNRHPWSEYSEGNGDWERPDKLFGNGEQVDLSAYVANADVNQRAGAAGAANLRFTNYDLRFGSEAALPQDFSAYVTNADVKQRVWDIMRGRSGDVEGEAVAEEWGKLAEVVSLRIAAKGEGKEERMVSGAEYIGRMVALIAATRKVLPERWAGARGVGQMLAWARWYAQMAEAGQVVRTDKLKGAIYEKALEAMRKGDEMRRNSYTEAEAEGWLRAHAGERLDSMLLKLARRMRRQIEQYVKERMREDMLETVRALYPKMEGGSHIKRGKAVAGTYRYAEYVREALMMRGDWVVNEPGHEEAVRRLEAKLRRGDLTGEERGKYERALEELREEEVNSLSEEIERQQRILDDPSKSEEAKEGAREYLHALMTFGGWRSKDFSECQQAYARFEEVIIQGKKSWQEQEERRRKKMGYIKKRVRQTQDRHKRSAWETESSTMNKRVEENAERDATGKDVVKTGALAWTSLSGKLYAAKRKLGGWFVERYTNAIAEMHVTLKRKQEENTEWVYRQLAEASGRHTVEGISDWIREHDEIKDTGMKLAIRTRHSFTMSAEDLREWVKLTGEEREAKREEMRKEAEKREEVEDRVPSEEALREMEVDFINDEMAGTEKKNYVYVWETVGDVPLKASKWGVLQAILTAEQGFYEHLLEDNGINDEVLTRMREYVGAPLLKLGYAMRGRLEEMRPELAEMHERMYGVPFPAHDNYFPGKFLNENTNPAQADGSVQAGRNDLPTRPGNLRLRSYHNRRIDWGASALNSFILGVQQQNEWLTTGEFIAEWADLFNDREFAAEMIGNLGKKWVDGVKQDLRTLANAGMQDAVNMAALVRVTRALCKVQAVGALAFKLTTIAKNAVSLLNGLVGGRVPIAELRDSETARILGSRHIGVFEFFAGVSGEFSLSDIAGQEFIKARLNEQFELKIRSIL